MLNKHSLTLKVRKEGLTDENLTIFKTLYKLEFLKNEDLIKVFGEFFIPDNKLKYFLIKYIQELKSDFSYDQWLILKDFKESGKHSRDGSSKEFHKAKYGENWEQKYNEKLEKSSFSLKQMVNLYGEEEGLKHYNQRIERTKIAGTLQGYINKYGEEEGQKRWKHFCERNKGNHSLERMIEKYGVEEGTRRYEQDQFKLKNKNYLWYYKMLYGEEDGEKRFNEKNLKNSNSSKEMKNAIWRIGSKCYLKWLKRMQQLGYNSGIPFSERSDFFQYQKNVWAITLKQPLDKLPNFEKRGHVSKEGTYAIDHKISISFGFNNNIPYEIIGNIDNLQMLPHSINSSKHSKCFSCLDYCFHGLLGDKLNDFKF